VHVQASLSIEQHCASELREALERGDREAVRRLVQELSEQ
jgi:hypothetical protein